jgi:hypothetical protein
MHKAPASFGPGVVLVLLLATLAAGCGSDSGLVSSSRSASMRASLSQVERNFNAGDCTAASQGAAALRTKIDALPSRVDRKVRRALAASAEHLQTLVVQRCRPAAPATTAPAQPAPSVQEKPGNGPKDKKPKKEKPPKDKGQPPSELPPGQDQFPPPDEGGTTPPAQEPGNGTQNPDGTGGAGL